MKYYKNTPEGKIVRQKYEDILPLSRPEPIKPRMTTLNRAKIFSPFAALRGYNEEISDQDRVQGLITKAELSDEDKEHLSDRLLEEACRSMLTFSGIPNIRSLMQLLKTPIRQSTTSSPMSQSHSSRGITRGASQFRKGGAQ